MNSPGKKTFKKNTQKKKKKKDQLSNSPRMPPAGPLSVPTFSPETTQVQVTRNKWSGREREEEKGKRHEKSRCGGRTA